MAKAKSTIVGSVNGVFGDVQNGKFGSVALGGPLIAPWIPGNPLPAGQRVMWFTFNPVAGHKAAVPELRLRTTGPFVLWTDNPSAPIAKSIPLAIPGGVSAPVLLTFRPKKRGALKGTLTVISKHATLTGTFRNRVAFTLRGTGQ